MSLRHELEIRSHALQTTALVPQPSAANLGRAGEEDQKHDAGMLRFWFN